MNLSFQALSHFYEGPLVRPTSAAEVKVAHSHFAKVARRLFLVSPFVSSLFIESLMAAVESNPPRALNAPSCEKVLNHSEDSSQTDAKLPPFEVTPNEVELEMFGRITHAYQVSWLKNASDLDAVIQSPTPVAPPLEWNDLEIAAHKERWDELLVHKDLRWPVVQRLLSALRDNLQSQNTQTAESANKTRVIRRPLFLGKIWMPFELLSPNSNGDNNRPFYLNMEEPLQDYVFIEADKAIRLNPNRTKDVHNIPISVNFLKLPDGSYISSIDKTEWLPTDTTELTKQTVKALERFRSEKVPPANEVLVILLGDLIEIDGSNHLAIQSYIHRQKTESSAALSFQYEYSFLPLDETRAIIKISRDELKDISQSEIDTRNDDPFLHPSFYPIKIGDKKYGIWQMSHGFWIFDASTKKPVPFFKDGTQNTYQILANNHKTADGWKPQRLQVLQTDTSAFLFSSWQSYSHIYDLSQINRARSEDDLLIAIWLIEGIQFLVIAQVDNKGYVSDGPTLREFELSTKALKNSQISQLRIVSGPNALQLESDPLQTFKYDQHSFFISMSNDLNSLYLINITDRSVQTLTLVLDDLLSMPLRGVFTAEKDGIKRVLVYLPMINLHTRLYDIYLVQVIGPENATTKDYEGLLPKLEAK